MKRRIFATILSIMLIFTFMPTITFATGTVKTAAGTQLTSTGGTLTSGEYYLADDVILSDNIVIDSGDTVTIDLNGHTLTGTGSDSVIRVNGTLNLKDTSTNGDGTITGGEYYFGGGVFVYGGSFNMSGGIISGNTAISYGGGVYVYKGSFTMTGGTICGNSAASGGGVFVYTGNFYLSGTGIISDNSASHFGGGVSTRESYDSSDGGSFYMSGGTISGNTADLYCGGVYVGGSFEMSGGTISDNTSSSYGGGVGGIGSFEMSDGTISYNTAYDDGGGVGMLGSFKMTGGTISYNTAGTYGGGVMVSNDGYSGDFSMTGGTISNNTAGTCGGGVCVYLNGSLTVADSPVITNNTGGNVYLTSGKYITLESELAATASIGVTVADAPTSSAAAQITATETNTDYYSSAVNYIFSDAADYMVQINSDGYLELSLPPITGSAAISGNAVYGETISAVTSDTPDAVTYQWMRDTEAITGATDSAYTLTAEDVGKSITVVISHSGYAGSLTATAVTVSKAELTTEMFTVNTDDETYTGAAITKTITSSLAEDTDYMVSYSDNTSVGTADITITGMENCIGSLTYSFTIKAAEQSISYGEDNVTKHINDTAFINELTRTAVYGTISYASDNTDVATVDENGKVTITGVGTAIITAVAASSDNYYEATASYTLTVTEHSYGDPIFTWSDDGRNCTVSFTCTDCGDVQTVTAAVSSEVKTVASETENGVTSYTATVTFGGMEYTDTKELTDILATGSTETDNSNETGNTETDNSDKAENTENTGNTGNTETESSINDTEDTSNTVISPKSGDDTNLWLRFILMVVGVVTLIYAWLYKVYLSRE